MLKHYFNKDKIMKNPEVTFLIPALNESLTMGEFVDWCFIGLKKANINGQIIIVDSSDDKTDDIALEHGAEVLKVPRKGLGQAYIDAIPYVRSPFIIMGDADLTYDTREIDTFIEKFREGYAFIMGSRFKGHIEKGAMPVLHQYFGTPLTTFILNKMYHSKFSDIHCGMRGVTLDALKRMNLKSPSWEYASEMIIKAIHQRLKCTEVPVKFYKDRKGRLSHHKRAGWHAPWVAGWLNLKAILIFGVDVFLYKLGLFMSILGFSGVALLYNGPMKIKQFQFSLHAMLIFLLVFLIGSQFCFTGVLAKAFYQKQNSLKSWRKIFSLEYVIPFVAIITLLGIRDIFPLFLEKETDTFYHAATGFGAILFGFIYFTYALFFNAIMKR